MKLENVLALKASSSIDYYRTALLVVGLDLNLFLHKCFMSLLMLIKCNVMVPFVPSKVKLDFVALVLTARFLYSQPCTNHTK